MAAAPPRAPDDPWLGRVLGGRYRIVRSLGSGGAGAVYEARQQDLARAVAIKILHQDLAADAVQLGRFRREARAAASIGHPNIVQLLDFADARPGEPAFLVLELVAGRSLMEIITREPVLSPARAVALVTQILAGLEAAHRAGVVHRDLKPGNVMVAPGPGGSEIPKLVDFGIAQMHESTTYQKLTRTGVIVGTPRYMSPEQASGGTIDGRTDLWAVGVILYRMLAGVSPFDGRPDQLILQIMRTDPPPLAPELGVPAALEAVVRRALEKKLEARWPTALAMSNALRAALGDIPATAEARLPARRDEQKTQALPMRLSIEEIGVVEGAERTTEEPRRSFPGGETSGAGAAVMVATPSVLPVAPVPRTSGALEARASGPPRVSAASPAASTSSPGVGTASPAAQRVPTPVSRLVLIIAGALALGLTVTGCLVAPWIGAAVGLWEWSHGGCVAQRP